jgi:alkylation response protein AidB-like acyl-CoA dehydrogenase
MTLITPESSNISITATGLEIRDELTFDQWRDLAPKFSEAMKCAAWVIGDWLVYGEDHFKSAKGEITSETYDAAVAATGIDRSTLHLYAHVSRNVPALTRVKALSWEHHRAVAKLNESEQKQWLEQATSDPAEGGVVSSRRLRKSIMAGRILTPEEMHPEPSDSRIENHIPYVNRLVAWWARMGESKWLQKSTPEERAAVRRDLEPVVAIYEEIGERSE